MRVAKINNLFKIKLKIIFEQMIFYSFKNHISQKARVIISDGT